MKKTIISLAGIGLIFAGCSGNPKEANEKNFTNAINKYLEEKKELVACGKVGNEFPIEDKYSNLERAYQQYVDMGLIKKEVKEITRKASPFDGLTNPFDHKALEKEVKDEIISFSLTEIGKENLKNGMFCFGKPTVSKIISFEGPKNFMGETVVEVKYKYALKNTPSWYNKEKEKETKIGLRLTENGWSHK